jgi:hypothetical protein
VRKLTEDALAGEIQKDVPIAVKDPGAINPQMMRKRIKSFFPNIPNRLPVLKKVHHGQAEMSM